MKTLDKWNVCTKTRLILHTHHLTKRCNIKLSRTVFHMEWQSCGSFATRKQDRRILSRSTHPPCPQAIRWTRWGRSRYFFFRPQGESPGLQLLKPVEFRFREWLFLWWLPDSNFWELLFSQFTISLRNWGKYINQTRFCPAEIWKTRGIHFALFQTT